MSFGDDYRASEAYVQACAAAAEKQRLFEENIFKRIKDHADGGVFELVTNKESLSGGFAKHLRDLGYEVDLTTYSMAKISWGRKVNVKLA